MKILKILLFTAIINAKAMENEGSPPECFSWIMRCLSALSGSGVAHYNCGIYHQATIPNAHNETQTRSFNEAIRSSPVFTLQLTNISTNR